MEKFVPTLYFRNRSSFIAEVARRFWTCLIRAYNMSDIDISADEVRGSTCDKNEQSWAGSKPTEQIKSGSKDEDQSRSRSISATKKKEGGAEEIQIGKGIRRGEDKGKSRISKGSKSGKSSDRKKEESTKRRYKSGKEEDHSELGLSEKQFADLMSVVRSSVQAMKAVEEEPPLKVRKTSVPTTSGKTNLQNLYEDVFSDSEGDMEEEVEEKDEDMEYLGKFFSKKSVSGPPLINTELAETVNVNLREVNDLSSTEIKDLMEKYQAPENVKNIITPKLNEELAVSNAVRGPDNRAVIVQALIGHALTAGLYLADELKSARKNRQPVDVKNALFKALDMITLMASAFTTATKKRQEACKFSVKAEYQKICLESKASTEWLFDDLQTKLKNSSENSKISPFGNSKNGHCPPMRLTQKGVGRQRYTNQGTRQEFRQSNYRNRPQFQRPLYLDKKVSTRGRRYNNRGKRQ